MTIKEDIHNKILADITSGHYKQNEIITALEIMLLLVKVY